MYLLAITLLGRRKATATASRNLCAKGDWTVTLDQSNIHLMTLATAEQTNAKNQVGRPRRASLGASLGALSNRSRVPWYHSHTTSALMAVRGGKSTECDSDKGGGWLKISTILRTRTSYGNGPPPFSLFRGSREIASRLINNTPEQRCLSLSFSPG